MTETNLPALAPAQLPSGSDLNTLLQIGDMLVKSGLLPQTLRTKEAAAVVVMKGNELGLPPMAALEGISVVQGRAVIGAHLMLALVKRAYGPGAIWVSETTNDHCTMSYRIPGVPETLSYTYTMADARTAGLSDKPTWRQHPGAMLRARAISATVKLAFPEVVGGMYVPGEIEGTEETVTPDGDVVIRVSAASVVNADAPSVSATQHAQVVDIQTGEIVAPAAPERAARASSRRTRQEQPATEPEPDPAPPTEAEIRQAIRNRIQGAAEKLGMTPDDLTRRMGEIIGRPNTEEQPWMAPDALRAAQQLEADVAAAFPEPTDADFEEVG